MKEQMYERKSGAGKIAHDLLHQLSAAMQKDWLFCAFVLILWNFHYYP